MGVLLRESMQKGRHIRQAKKNPENRDRIPGVHQWRKISKKNRKYKNLRYAFWFKVSDFKKMESADWSWRLQAHAMDLLTLYMFAMYVCMCVCVYVCMYVCIFV